MTTLDQQSDNVQAAEYVLGTLSPARARLIEARLPRDASLRDAVAFWEERFAGLGMELAPEPPDDRVWRGVTRRLGFDATPGQVRFWRTFAIAASCAAVTLGALQWMQRSAQAPDAVAPTNAAESAVVAGNDAAPAEDESGTFRPKVMTHPLEHELFADASRAIVPAAAGGQPAYASLIRDETVGVGWLVTIGPDQRRLIVTALGTYHLDNNQSLELWLQPSYGQRPVSLGLIPVHGRRELYLPPDAVPLSDSATMAISLEPRGGSPNGWPSGQTVSIAPVSAESG